jgi:hypothetical protein
MSTGNSKSALKYELPEFLAGRVGRVAYIRWLQRKAAAHVKRDRKRVKHPISIAEYKAAINSAVHSSQGVDWYTGENLDWEKISTYDNAASQSGRSEYKASLALLPTVDHVLATDGTYNFVICSWRTNVSKNDLPLNEYLILCRKVIARHTMSSCDR